MAVVPFIPTEKHRVHLQPIVDGLAALPEIGGEDIALVASYNTLVMAKRRGYKRIVLAQHGAGQSYGGDPKTTRNPGYPGGDKNEAVGLFLCPNDYSASRWQQRYPSAAVRVVGSPRLDTLPRRHSIGLQCDVWSDLVAAIQHPPRMSDTTDPVATVCAAHAIADANPSAPSASNWKGILGSRNTTDSDISPDAQTQRAALRDRAAFLTAALASAMSRCIDDSGRSCRGSATSVDRQTVSKRLSAGILPKTFGGLAGTGAHSLLIQTTTFGSVSLAMSCTTAKVTNRGIPATVHKLPSDYPVIATSFHWNAYFSPEANSAWQDFAPALPDLARQFRVIGTGHPQRRDLQRLYDHLGIEFVSDFDEVCRRADVLVFDNTSAGFEFAATGRPVVVLNSRSYRRDVHHGGRFWDWAGIGVNVDRAADLVHAVTVALDDGPDLRRARQETLPKVYRADLSPAEAIVEWAA